VATVVVLQRTAPLVETSAVVLDPTVEVLCETAGELVLARLDYGPTRPMVYELVTHPFDCSPLALSDAAAHMPAGLVPISVLPSACLGDRGETTTTFYAAP
jgi:hypothetical protein